MRYITYLCMALCALLHAEEEVFTFVEHVKQEHNQLTWTVKKTEKTVILEGVEPRGKTHIEADQHLFFHHFHYEGPTTAYSMEYQAGILAVHGVTESGNRKMVRYNLGGEPWVQQFWFGLHPFLLSSRKSFKFSIINPKNFDRVRMVAYKEQIEPVTIDGVTRPALRVKVTLQGFKSMFWSGTAWYDPDTLSFLKYQATSGPNTPVTTVQRTFDS